MTKIGKEHLEGKLLSEQIEGVKYVMVKATDKVINGPCTRFDPVDPSQPVVVSANLIEYISKLEIDKKKLT